MGLGCAIVFLRTRPPSIIKPDSTINPRVPGSGTAVPPPPPPVVRPPPRSKPALLVNPVLVQVTSDVDRGHELYWLRGAGSACRYRFAPGHHSLCLTRVPAPILPTATTPTISFRASTAINLNGSSSLEKYADTVQSEFTWYDPTSEYGPGYPAKARERDLVTLPLP